MRASTQAARSLVAVSLLSLAGCPASGVRSPAQAKSVASNAAGEGEPAAKVSVTILSTSNATVGEGEWGFSALVRAGSERILFDAGAGSSTVLRNAEAIGLDLSSVTTVVLSHHHDDHVGGLLTLRESLRAKNPAAMSTVHVARGMFEPRRFGKKTHEVNDMIGYRSAFEESGGRFVVHDQPESIAPGVWVTGPVPRSSIERNYSGARRVLRNDQWTADPLPESQGLVVRDDRGLLVITGCGHAGITNIVDVARTSVGDAPVRVFGGFHLYRAKDHHIDWTIDRLVDQGVTDFFAAHCTGERAIAKAEAVFGRPHAMEVAVGWRWSASAQ